MTVLDYIVIAVYMIGIVSVGVLYSRRIKTSNDMFAAGGKSPWWVSGLSGFMTMFSAGTFVVWGGIAYRYGLVAVVISMCYGISALLVGWFLAGHWRKMGVSSASEFLQLRFGQSIVQFYTWLSGIVIIFSLGGSIYALALMVCALIELPAGHLLADPTTGHLSVTFTSILLCAIVVAITFTGGLWAVLMTDVMQFIVLIVSVIFIVPLCFIKIGGLQTFISSSPAGYFQPTANEFTWWFLVGWVVIHFFKIGGEWAFVQRYTCVPSAKDAKKSAYIFGVMYLISPIFWMLPPMIYRINNPDANQEQAYILASQWVLPTGMIGLMIAAMASATASMVTTLLNVYAGAFTSEFYKGIVNPNASEKQQIWVGRAFTLMLGVLVLSGAIAIPRFGTYTSFIISITALLTGPLVLPTIWGMFSKKITQSTAWLVTIIGFITALVCKFGLQKNGLLESYPIFKQLSELIQINTRVADLVVGTMIPLSVLIIAELMIKKPSPRLTNLSQKQQEFQSKETVRADSLPGFMVAYTVLVLSLMIFSFAAFNQNDRIVLILFATTLLLIAIVAYTAATIIKKRNSKLLTQEIAETELELQEV